MAPVRIDDYRKLARERLPAGIADYIDGGAGDEITVRANRRDLAAIRLLPLALRDVSTPDLSVGLLGRSFPVPLGFGPTAFHRMVHDEGEVATARAARAAGVPMAVSAMSSIALEEIAERSGHGDLWLQTYIFRDRALTERLVRRAEEAGYRCVLVTLGCPVPGKRDRNITNRFVLPPGVTAANFGRSAVVVHNNPVHSVAGAALDPSVTWRDLEWLRGRTGLPVLLKGVLNPLDVAPALDLGVAGIVVSNHGGRQLDTTMSTIAILPEIAAAVAGRVPVLVDSGFRRGTDVLKAIMLGADAVLLGRPVLWALAAGGEQGVADAADLLVEELRVALQTCGLAGLADARRNAAAVIRR
ncbi:alpha-hydroxy acid oxidase [Actinoplanes sp. NPDC049599]|uniref:alpha-hydroxy acid oxidase n=1 Tax=Actinoplanes sp. NPDC049599 TaxID=3363903 RepID=UPI0037BCE722